MYLDPTNYNDADKYFSGCYIKVREYGDTLILIKNVTERALWGQDEFDQLVCIDIDGEHTGKKGYELDYIIPKKTYFQFGSQAHLLTRIPAKMWKKGINKQNTNVFRLTSVGDFKLVDLTFKILKGFTFKPGYGNLNSLDTLESVALSPRFALTAGGDLFLDNNKIGKFYKESRSFVVQELFLDEIKSLFPGVVCARL